MIECQLSRTGETGEIPVTQVFYSFHDSPYGSCLIAFVEDNKNKEKVICHLVFVDENSKAAKEEKEKLLRLRFPGAQFHQESRQTKELVDKIFYKDHPESKTRLRVLLKGTEFQMNVWEELTRIPVGTLVTYAEVAQQVGKPKAVRAVGSALGANQVVYLIPCHRVICKSGYNKFTGCVQRKISMQEYERNYVDQNNTTSRFFKA
ncbi:uncharacterized protein LOC106643094 [Copidosoma floridanum]|uniref:uncharacterized protein LOC106643094 n=1 Tax=Copidosoma floridanum TaxID=29053 RepID=UPI0006C95FAD|nr:uncharacterized protein LOC106643094 [Copidosoma floridanum]